MELADGRLSEEIQVESGKVPSGLGKGLAGILGDNSGIPVAPGFASLVGGEGTRDIPEVRKLVNGLALKFISDLSNSDGAIIARQGGKGELPTVTTQLPSEWDNLNSFGLELAGSLHRSLYSGEDGADQRDIGGRSVLLIRQSDAQEVTTSAAVVRGHRFSEAESETVSRLIRSVSASTSDDKLEVDVADLVDIESIKNEGEISVSLCTRTMGDDGFASATAPTETEAAADAACNLCAEPLELLFAGETNVGGSLVSLVVLRSAVASQVEAPVFGLAVGSKTPAVGAVEAVLRATRVLGISLIEGMPAV